MKITVLTWCVSFLPILLLIMLLAVSAYLPPAPQV